MRAAIVFVSVLAVSSAFTLEPGLTVKFDVGLGIGKTFFYEVPQYVEDAIDKKWVLMEKHVSPMRELMMYCVPRYVLCAMYDPDTHYVAGVQVGLPLNDYKNAKFDWEIQGYIPWTPSDEAGTIMTKHLFFIAPDYLSKSIEERNKTAAAKIMLQGKSVYATGFNQELMEIPTDVKGIVETGFTKQACIPWMGQHYYYKMTSETECKADVLLNWFPLTSGDKLIGMGFVSFGTLPQKSEENDYFERPPQLAVMGIVPRGPQCLYDLAADPTLTTMHIYAVKQPWLVLCPLF